MPEIPLPGGARLHYLESNPSRRPTVLLLHGLGATGQSWQLQTPPLVQAGYRVLAPDAPGFGNSSSAKGAVSIAQMASAMVRLLRSLEIERADVVGLSMGGTIALRLVLEHSELVGHLVLVSTFAHLRIAKPMLIPYYAARVLLVLLFGPRVQATAVARRVFSDQSQEPMREAFLQEVASAAPRSYRGAMRDLATFDVRQRLGEIRRPTLVVGGDQDTTIPLPLQKELVVGIRGARLAIVHGAGHAVNVDHAEEFNRILVEFLSSS